MIIKFSKLYRLHPAGAKSRRISSMT